MTEILTAEDFPEIIVAQMEIHPGYFEEVVSCYNYLQEKDRLPQVITRSSGTILRSLKESLTFALEKLVSDGIYTPQEARKVRELHNQWSMNQAQSRILNKYLQKKSAYYKWN